MLLIQNFYVTNSLIFEFVSTSALIILLNKFIHFSFSSCNKGVRNAKTYFHKKDKALNGDSVPI